MDMFWCRIENSCEACKCSLGLLVLKSSALAVPFESSSAQQSPCSFVGGTEQAQVDVPRLGVSSFAVRGRCSPGTSPTSCVAEGAFRQA